MLDSIRFAFSVIVCRLLIFAGRIVHKGTSLPGEIVLKIYPKVLTKIKLPAVVIAVTGSNGKTSTSEMITDVLEKAGKKVLNNKEGSNQTAGVTTLLLSKASLSGKIDCDCLVLECDERYTKYIFKYIKPTHFVITNLYRDQLTRNGHPFFVFDRIKEAVELIPDAKLILNADDPIISQFGINRPSTVFFGMAQNDRSSYAPDTVYEDCAYCPICGEAMKYNFYHYAHLGDFECTGCGYHRNKPKYEVEKADFSGKRIIINGKGIKLAFESRYNIYNICSAYAVCSEVGVNGDIIASVLSEFVQQRGRQVKLKAGKNSGLLLISKHENSIAYNQNLEYIVNLQKPCTLVIVVDSISRKYYTTETSWLWDISFEKLSGSQIDEVLLCGKYSFDLAVRFSVIDLKATKLRVIPNLDDMAEALKENGKDGFYLMTCFSDKDKVFSRLEALSPTAK